MPWYARPLSFSVSLSNITGSFCPYSLCILIIAIASVSAERIISSLEIAFASGLPLSKSFFSFSQSPLAFYIFLKQFWGVCHLGPCAPCLAARRCSQPLSPLFQVHFASLANRGCSPRRRTPETPTDEWLRKLRQSL